jgi:hypothetical protein
VVVKESLRDVVTGELSLEYFAKRLVEGWKIEHIEWVRDTGTAQAPVEVTGVLNGLGALPYGLRVREDGGVEENPTEIAVLLLMLEDIVREKRVQEIAAELNQRGFATREATRWNAVDVFNLLPRLIEAGPLLLKSNAWQQRRADLQSRPSARPN